MCIQTTKDMWGQLTQVALTFTTIVCGGCGIPFGVPTNYYDRLYNSNGSFYCPNGCSRRFTAETEEQKLKRSLQRRENELAQTTAAKIQLESQLNTAKRKLARVAAGKCPCCEKNYKHLASHMKNKHPELLK